MKYVHFAKLMFFILLRVGLFAAVAIVLWTTYDKWLVNNRPANEYVNYTSFVVQNAREGEDVNFQVCREHRRTITTRQPERVCHLACQ